MLVEIGAGGGSLDIPCEIKPKGVPFNLGKGTDGGREDKEYGCSLKHELLRLVTCHINQSQGEMPYLLENRLAIIKVKCSKNHLELIGLSALGPASGDQVPFRFEVAA